MSKQLNIEGIPVTNAAANLLNCALTSAAGGVNVPLTQPKVIITKVRAINKASSPQSITLYKGLTGGSLAGTEWGWNAKQIPANDAVEFFCNARFDSTDFLSGLASANTSVVLNIDAELDFT